jgi:hypothetical protein
MPIGHRTRVTRKSTEIFSKVTFFLSPKNDQPNHHKKPSTHHVLTTKNHPKNAEKRTTPL